MSLTVKAFCEKNSEVTEIRRFPVDPGASTNFAYFCSKIPQVFSTLAGKSFDVYWKDSDGDLIAFSSDEELTDALGFVSDGVFRVYIREKKPSSGLRNEGEVHPGVVCDGCEGSICGSRFKCMECPDYDLCSVCESNGKHADHKMIRLRNPNQSLFPGFDSIFPHGNPHHPSHPPHHGPMPPPPYMGPFGGMGPGWGSERPAWPIRKIMKRCWKQWMKHMWLTNEGEACGGRESEDDVKQCKEPRKDDCADVRKTKDNMQKDGNNTCRGDNSEQEGSQEEYLRNVGESVAAMLDPLGISVDVDVENQGKRKRVHQGRGGRWGRGGCRRGMNPFGPWALGGWGRGGWGRGGWGNQWEQCQQQGRDSQEPQPGTSQQGQYGKRHDAKTETSQIEQTEASAPSPADIHMNSPLQQNESDGDWMMLTKEKSSGEMEANPTSPRAEEPQEQHFQIYPSSEARHPDPKINEALKQLLSMGFTNEGGWLVSLLEAKGGDINKTLDALKPLKSQ